MLKDLIKNAKQKDEESRKSILYKNKQKALLHTEETLKFILRVDKLPDHKILELKNNFWISIDGLRFSCSLEDSIFYALVCNYFVKKWWSKKPVLCSRLIANADDIQNILKRNPLDLDK